MCGLWWLFFFPPQLACSGLTVMWHRTAFSLFFFFQMNGVYVRLSTMCTCVSSACLCTYVYRHVCRTQVWRLYLPLLIFLNLFLCVRMCTCVERPEENVGSLGAGVTGDWATLHTLLGIWASRKFGHTLMLVLNWSSLPCFWVPGCPRDPAICPTPLLGL